MSDPLEPLGRLLVERGVLSEQALAAELRSRPSSESHFLTQLLEAGHATEPELLSVLAELHGEPCVDVSASAFLTDVLDLIPRPVAEGDRILPLSTEGGRLHVAVSQSQLAQSTVDEVRFITGMEVSLYTALVGPLDKVIVAAYDARERGERIFRGPQVAPDAPPGLTIVQPHHEATVTEEISLPPEGDEVVIEAEEPELGRDLAAELAEELADVPFDLPEKGKKGGEAKKETKTTTLRPSPPAVVTPTLVRRLPGEIDLEIGDEGDDEDEEELEAIKVRVGPKKILVVDDEPDIVKLCTRALQLKGYAVESAADGRIAEELLEKDPPDLVLLDAMLPHVHGFEICQRIKANKALRGVQVIMMSAVYRGWRFAQDARETYGADDYVEKPFHLADLLRRVEERLQAGAEKKTEPPKREAERLYKLGMEALEAGKLTEARSLLEAALREDPFSPRTHFALARTLSLHGDVYRAISEYERAVELRPALFPALRNLANLYLEKGFRRKAAETLERALASAPDPATREQIRAQLLRLL